MQAQSPVMLQRFHGVAGHDYAASERKKAFELFEPVLVPSSGHDDVHSAFAQFFEIAFRHVLLP